MKQQTIAAMVAAGVPAAKAEAHWNTVRDKLNDGDEPTAEGLAIIKDSAIEGALPAVAAAAFIKAIRGTEPPKGRRFKAGKSYSPEDLASFYPTEKDNAAYVAACNDMAMGCPWVIFKDTYRETESGRYLKWYRDEDIPPATVMVDGEPVAPVRPGEERTPKEAYVDPFSPGAFLDVERKSASGASFAGYSDESLSAMAFLFSRSLRGEGKLSLVRFAEDNRGKSPAQILAPFTVDLAAWNRTKPANRPAPKAISRPFVEPIAPTSPAPRDGTVARFDNVPLVYFVGCAYAEKAADGIIANLGGYSRRGRVRILRDMQIPPGENVKSWQSARMREAALVVFFVTATTMNTLGTDSLALASRIAPVIVGPYAGIELDPVIGRLESLPKGSRRGRVGKTDEDWAEIAGNIASLLRIG